MNSPIDHSRPTRRKFLGQCCAAVGATGMLSALSQLRLIGAIASPGNGPTPVRTGATALPADYKALVCLFLAGGNDANNVIVPTDTAGYQAYTSGRGALSLPRASLLGITPKTSDGHTYGLHPALPGLQSLFGQGKLAVLANVGTLAYPLTRPQFLNQSVPLPAQLFSHSDQQVQWQSSVPDQPFTTGWGGRLADLTNAFNSNNAVSMSITLDGDNSFEVGRNVVQFAVNPEGAIVVDGSGTGATVDGVRTSAMNDLMAAQYGNLIDSAFGGVNRAAIANSQVIASYLNGAAPFATAFPTTNLGQQMRTIARLIAAAPQLGLKRQVFFARMGGYDLHGSQLSLDNPVIGAHTDLLTDVGASLSAFYNATVELGCASQVTTFTASDFGRAFRTNGDGSDHGWGSHHFILGGAVKGGDFYGKMPAWVVDGPDDTGSGRWIPTTSVDEYSATLATWFGVSPTDLPTVLPNIGRFAKPSLGFLG
jgi:uncharacterized protein (DUF1501 family)